MARIQRANLPGSLLVQLLTRMSQRHISQTGDWNWRVSWRIRISAFFRVSAFLGP